jgi:hypothetical protein
MKCMRINLDTKPTRSVVLAFASVEFCMTLFHCVIANRRFGIAWYPQTQGSKYPMKYQLLKVPTNENLGPTLSDYCIKIFMSVNCFGLYFVQHYFSCILLVIFGVNCSKQSYGQVKTFSVSQCFALCENWVFITVFVIFWLMNQVNTLEICFSKDHYNRQLHLNLSLASDIYVCVCVCVCQLIDFCVFFFFLSLYTLLTLSRF